MTARVETLAYEDEALGHVDLPGGRMAITRGLGSGLAVAPDGTVWALGDRGPNIGLDDLEERYGLALDGPEGAKAMPMVAVGPAMVRLRVAGGRVERMGVTPLVDASGAHLPGVPLPGGAHARLEPALTLNGTAIAPDPAGADTEGIAALADGTFLLSEEYGPSLLRVDGNGRVLERWVPAGTERAFDAARAPLRACLPAIAAARRINRGFEAIARSADGRLFVAFQSPLSHPDDDAHRRARHLRLWELDVASGAVVAQHLYPLDPPESFRRDAAEGAVKPSDLKLCELTALADGRLLALERASKSARVYAIRPEGPGLPPEHLETATRTTLEEMSAAGRLGVPVLQKVLVLDTDDHPEIGADLEGMTVIAPDTLLLASDNDFGVMGAATGFWRVTIPGLGAGLTAT